ncbi:Branched-chain amino acid transport system permease protein LivM [uncultured Alphaproteobacteria bacterium]|uniref:Branched-chain amino acid transport system permease protein LivM n=1 Tax=uncultured Alphaproteobacteria bacterium TaxID=91750 RepID=A0A212K7B6_9PROT|nr:Branched-chain amino acid transport system permease protein LivM [uncultured Alphaproteobacteria bacterium]
MAPKRPRLFGFLRRGGMDFIVIQALNGLAGASSLFLVAAGLSLIFGVSRVVNFAHGTVFMIGAYVAWTLIDRLGVNFWLAAPLAALATAGLGGLIEILVLRRLYGRHELLPLLATFALVLIAHDAVPLIWGAQDVIGPRAPGLTGAVTVMGRRLPAYDLFLIGVAAAMMAALWLLLHRTRFGRVVRAATDDPEMAAALGIRQDRLFTSVFMLGCGLAGLGGALRLPRETLHHSLDTQVIVSAFVVVVIGGMGSIGGAFVASGIVGVVSAFGIVVWPQGTLAMLFVIMAAVLVVRPRGLFGAPTQQEAHRPLLLPSPPLGGYPRRAKLAVAGSAAALAGFGLVASPFALDVATQVLIAVLFAASLHLLIGWAGLISFGHAALFGLGAYGAALLGQSLPLGFAIAGGAAAAALGAAAFGALVRRMKGVYLAMLTLAFSQLLFAAAFQWVELTGGDNGILGLWPDPPWDTAGGWYALTLALALLAMLALARLYRTPFAYILRAAQGAEARARADALPVDATRVQAFAVSGAVAGLAGALLVFLKGSAFPSLFAVPQSVDGLVMVLLGGVAHPLGPVAGAAAYSLGVTVIATLTPAWHMIVGALILVLTQALPGGLLRREEGP